jgi:hypothetical protein
MRSAGNLKVWQSSKSSPAGFSTSVARQVLHLDWSFYRPLWEFHRPPNESLAGNPSVRRHNRFASCETNAVHAFENCRPDPAFIPCGRKRIAGNIEPRQDFLRCRPPAKRSAENPAFLRLAGSCRRNFRPLAGNPNHQPEIQKNRWKSAEVAELFCSCGKSQIFS